jgi:hypothetical protein
LNRPHANIYLKIHQQSWTKLTGRPEKRKKKNSTSKDGPPAKRSATTPSTTSSKPQKAEKPMSFTLVLAEHTEKVNDGVYVFPNAARYVHHFL